MKVIDSPRTGKVGQYVYYPSPYGQCCRSLVVPRDTESQYKAIMRAILGCCSAEWSHLLTEQQRQRWCTAARSVPSHPTLAQYAHLHGHLLYVKINSTLRCTGSSASVLEPPAPVAFPPNPVQTLEIVNGPEGGARLRLTVETLSEDVMVYGQPPCSAGRMKRRRVYYLGLAGPATNGQVDITDLYTARFGAPQPGKKVFIVTCQTRNGWQATEYEFSDIVPPLPSAAKPQAKAAPVGEHSSPGAAPLKSSAAQGTSNVISSAVIASPEDGRTPAPDRNQSITLPPAAEAPLTSPAAANPVFTQYHPVYKSGTREVQGVHRTAVGEQSLSNRCATLVHAVRMALNRLGMMREVTASP